MSAALTLRRWLIPTAALLAATGTGVLDPGVPTAGPTGPRVVVTDDAGTVVVEAGLPDTGFHIEYQHSYYDQPATESFQPSSPSAVQSSAQDEGIHFRLVVVSSPSEAVLDYYDLPGARSRGPGAVHVLRPTGTAPLAQLALIGTPTGRRTLVVDGHRFPLYAASEPARHLVLHLQP